ncbi:hypothetical protein [Pseudomarimonas arenosa]|uniref:Uncharacterized protein n=1 Tax=Pseudomarimonas arenosa TaxID=2774145 RepID=A0AAW3ZL99_9GAMM|nr:hypothetical protein [Pseudomarimonas arenosa]MBD8526816.1 hypothetical protein [Pseudomarimonas arenosa]
MFDGGAEGKVLLSGCFDEVIELSGKSCVSRHFLGYSTAATVDVDRAYVGLLYRAYGGLLYRAYVGLL